MYYKKNNTKILKNLKYFKISLLIIIFIVSFFLGSYAQKNHLYYTFIKPIIFQNLNFIKKQIQGKFQEVDKIYINIDFQTMKELNNRRIEFIKNNSINVENNQWLDVTLDYRNDTYESKIRFKGRSTDTHLNPTMRNENISYKIKIKKREEGNILGMREFNLMDLRRRGYLLEWYARKFLQNEGLIFLDYKFVNLFINGKDHGIYAMDEAISEATLTRNKRRNSVSVRIDNNYVGTNVDLSLTNPERAGFNNVYIIADIDTLNETIGASHRELTNRNIFNNSFPITIKEKIISKPDGKTLLNYNTASNLIDNFRKGKLKTEEVFDIDQLAKGFAASDIFDGWHGINWTNLSFYFNPISLKLEPIFQDWYNEGSVSTGNEEVQRSIRYLDVYNYGIFYKNIFSSDEFLEKYVHYLEKYSNDKYFKDFNKKIQKELDSNLKKIYKSSPYYIFPKELFERKKKLVKSFVYHYDPIYFSLVSSAKHRENSNIAIFEFGNKHILPIKINKIIFTNFNGDTVEKLTNFNLKPRNLKMFSSKKFDQSPIEYELLEFENLKFKKFKEVKVQFNVIGSSKKFYKSLKNPIERLPKEKIILDNFIINSQDKSILNKDEFIDIVDNNYIIREGNWIIYDDLFIPKDKKLIISAGTELQIINSSQIISKSPIIAIGLPDKKIFINSPHNDYKIGQCIIILENPSTSIFENVEFNNLRNCDKGSINSEGSLNVYKSKIKMKNIKFSNNKYGDDGLNFINSEFELDNVHLNNIYADGLDLDYSVGTIKDFSCINCLNDGIDISNTTLRLENFGADDIFDKAISVGENSIIEAKNISIKNSNIGLAIKDGSTANIQDVNIESSKYPLALYVKKQEFGVPEIKINSMVLTDNMNPILLEDGARYKIDTEAHSKIIKSNIFKTLYPNAEYRNLP